MINELTVQQTQLPQTLDELAKFVLIGREKLTAVKAEIRAIDKLQLAQEVRDQKRDEAQWLSGALIDAEARLGSLLSEIPKAGANQHTDAALFRSGAEKQKTKAEIITGLGFSGDQAQRFETLADNQDLIEQVKQEAKENDDIPTRTRVLDLARERNRRGDGDEHDYYNYLDDCEKIARKYNNAIYAVSALEASSEDFQKWAVLLENDIRKRTLERTEEAVENLIKVKQFLRRPLK